MKKTRVYQIAEEVGMSNKDILAKLKELGIEAQNEKAELEEEEVELLMDLLEEEPSVDDLPKVGVIAKIKNNPDTIGGK